MNLHLELDRLTAPSAAASPARCLSRAEIEALQAEGLITDVALIPASHALHREIFPEGFRGKSSYARTLECKRRWLNG